VLCVARVCVFCVLCVCFVRVFCACVHACMRACERRCSDMMFHRSTRARTYTRTRTHTAAGARVARLNKSPLRDPSTSDPPMSHPTTEFEILQGRLSTFCGQQACSPPALPSIPLSLSSCLSIHMHMHARGGGDTHIACHFLGCKPSTNPYTTAFGDVAETRTNHGLARVTRAHLHAPLTRLTIPS